MIGIPTDKTAAQKILRAVMVVAAFAALGTQTAHAQSNRRSGKAAEPSRINYAQSAEPKKPQTVYTQIGKVLSLKDGFAIVALGSVAAPKTPDGWTEIVFSADIMRKPKSILEKTGNKNKNCAVYKIAEGTPAPDDLVIIMSKPPAENK